MYKGKNGAFASPQFFFSQKLVGEILGSKVPTRYIRHRVNSRRGIVGLPCTAPEGLGMTGGDFLLDQSLSVPLFQCMRT